MASTTVAAIQTIITSPDGNDQSKIIQLQTSIDFNSIDGLTISNLTTSDAFRIILLLFKLECITNHQDIRGSVKEMESILTMIQSIPSLKRIVNSGYNSNHNHTELFVKIKYNDVLTDYQFLIDEPDYGKFVELINKKVLIINNIPKTVYPDLLKLMQLKIFQLYLISDYDSRKPSILSYLMDSLTGGNDDGSVVDILSLLNSHRIISIETYQRIIALDYHNNYYNLITQYLDSSSILLNIVENNLILLPNYYNSIKLTKVYKILDVDRAINLENVIFNMIQSKKFSAQVKLDQIKQLILFNSNVNEDQILNNHIQEVGSLVNQIYVKLP